MKATSLSLSVVLTMGALSQPVLACGGDGSAHQLPEQAKVAEFKLELVAETIRLEFQGKLAEAVFLHLSAKDLQTRDEGGKLIKDAVGIRCEYANSAYSCLQVFDFKGFGKIGLTRLEPEAAPPYITLEYKDQTAKTLYETLTVPGTQDDLGDGEIRITKTGKRFSCEQRAKGESVSYKCIQFMINNGKSWGEGIDPVVTVGTHSLVAELSDAGVFQRPVLSELGRMQNIRNGGVQ